MVSKKNENIIKCSTRESNTQQSNKSLREINSRSVCRTHTPSFLFPLRCWLNECCDVCQCVQNLTPWHMLSSASLKQRFPEALSPSLAWQKSGNSEACLSGKEEVERWRDAKKRLSSVHLCNLFSCSPSPFLETIDKSQEKLIFKCAYFKWNWFDLGGEKAIKWFKSLSQEKRLQNWICVAQVLRAEDGDYTLRST